MIPSTPNFSDSNSKKEEEKKHVGGAERMRSLRGQRRRGFSFGFSNSLRRSLFRFLRSDFVCDRLSVLFDLSSSPVAVIIDQRANNWGSSWKHLSTGGIHRDQRKKTMYLQCYINEKGEKVYTTKKESPLGSATESAHPARFSPDDKYSKERVLLKKRFGLLPIQGAPVKY